MLFEEGGERWVDFNVGKGVVRGRSQIIFSSALKNFCDPDSLLDIAISRPALRSGAFRLSNLTYLFYKKILLLYNKPPHKIKTPRIFLGFLFCAEEVRFELTVPVKRLLFSRQAHSTTLPLLPAFVKFKKNYFSVTVECEYHIT